MYGQLRQRGWTHRCCWGTPSPLLSPRRGSYSTVGGVRAGPAKVARRERRSPEVTGASAQRPHPLVEVVQPETFIHKKKRLRDERVTQNPSC